MIVHEIAERAGRALRVVAPERIEQIARTDVHQGVVAMAAPLRAADLDASARTATDVFLVALDGVTDPRNLGAIMRSAETAGATGIVLPRHRAARDHPRGGEGRGRRDRVPADRAGRRDSRPRSSARRAAGCWTVGLDERGDRSSFELDLADQPLVLVLGAEGRGLRA